MEHVKNGKITIERVVEKMAHNPAILFRIKERGFIREGYYADIVIVDPNRTHSVDQNNILYKCGWSPFEGYTFSSAIDRTFVNGEIVYENNKVMEGANGMRLSFNPAH